MRNRHRRHFRELVGGVYWRAGHTSQSHTTAAHGRRRLRVRLEPNPGPQVRPASAHAWHSRAVARGYEWDDNRGCSRARLLGEGRRGHPHLEAKRDARDPRGQRNGGGGATGGEQPHSPFGRTDSHLRHSRRAERQPRGARAYLGRRKGAVGTQYENQWNDRCRRGYLAWNILSCGRSGVRRRSNDPAAARGDRDSRSMGALVARELCLVERGYSARVCAWRTGRAARAATGATLRRGDVSLLRGRAARRREIHGASWSLCRLA